MDVMSKPGVVVYFDIRPCIARLSLSEKGQLFDAILDYAENGVEPEIDGGLRCCLGFHSPSNRQGFGKIREKG